jgi:hypothetical protein
VTIVIQHSLLFLSSLPLLLNLEALRPPIQHPLQPARDQKKFSPLNPTPVRPMQRDTPLPLLTLFHFFLSSTFAFCFCSLTSPRWLKSVNGANLGMTEKFRFAIAASKSVQAMEPRP